MNRIILFAGLCLLVALSGFDHKKKEIHESGKFTVTSPIKVDTSYDKEYVSQIQSFRNIEIRAQEKGYLEKINVDEANTCVPARFFSELCQNYMRRNI